MRLSIHRARAPLIVLYYCCAVIVLAWFLGAILRGEQSAWLNVELERDARRFGSSTSNTVLETTLYLLFYTGLVLVPYGLLGLPVLKSHGDRHVRWFTSLWVAASFLIFVKPLSAFFRAIPSGTLFEWLLLLWLLSTAFVVFARWVLYRRGD